jgi:hypothetical protein
MHFLRNIINTHPKCITLHLIFGKLISNLDKIQIISAFDFILIMFRLYIIKYDISDVINWRLQCD